MWNIYVDDLVASLNRIALLIPRALFFADDGVLLAQDLQEAQKLLDIVTEWCRKGKIMLNVGKCGLLATRGQMGLLKAEHHPIPVVEQYVYLGFPIGRSGIDFVQCLRNRIKSALGIIAWLDRSSASWGPAHRLRVYRQMLAPVFEYGAPLIAAWFREGNQVAFTKAIEGHREIVAWIAGGDKRFGGVAAALLGILDLDVRFEQLRVRFWHTLSDRIGPYPLLQIIREPVCTPRSSRFLRMLDGSSLWKEYIHYCAARDPHPILFMRWQRATAMEAIAAMGQRFQLTRRIPTTARSQGALFGSDITLAAPFNVQEDLLRYRLGIFMIRRRCKCGQYFYRGHEACPALNIAFRLSRAERAGIRYTLGLANGLYTEVDMLLNHRQTQRAAWILEEVRKKLREEYVEQMADIDSNSRPPASANLALE